MYQNPDPDPSLSYSSKKSNLSNDANSNKLKKKKRDEKKNRRKHRRDDSSDPSLSENSDSSVIVITDANDVRGRAIGKTIQSNYAHV